MIMVLIPCGTVFKTELVSKLTVLELRNQNLLEGE